MICMYLYGGSGVYVDDIIMLNKGWTRYFCLFLGVGAMFDLHVCYLFVATDY